MVINVRDFLLATCSWHFELSFLSPPVTVSWSRYIPLTVFDRSSRSHSIIFHCNFSSFSRQFGQASRGKYPRGLRSPCKINNPYRRFRFSFRSASRVTCLFHFYCNEATSLHRPTCLFTFFFFFNCTRLYSVHFWMHNAVRRDFISL